jgi:hypothetical protein
MQIKVPKTMILTKQKEKSVQEIQWQAALSLRVNLLWLGWIKLRDYPTLARQLLRLASEPRM